MGAIANKAKGTAVERAKKAPGIRDDALAFVLARQADILNTLPEGADRQRFARIMIAALRQKPAPGKASIMDCSPDSIMGALVTCATLNLEPGPLGHVHLIPYWDKPSDCHMLRFQFGYQGCIELARRSGNIRKIMAEAIREGDDFVLSYGFGGTCTHVPKLRDRGEVWGYYAYAELMDGGLAYVYMSWDEVDAHRKQFAGSGPAWRTSFDEMAKKTLLLRLWKQLPISVEYKALATGATVTVEQDERSKRLRPVIEMDSFPEEDEEPARIAETSQSPEPAQVQIGDKQWLVDSILSTADRAAKHKYTATDINEAAGGFPLTKEVLNDLDTDTLSGMLGGLDELITVAREG